MRHGPWIIVATLIAAGCSHEVYEIDLRPNGEKMERTLTFWRVTGSDIVDAPADEVEQLKKLFPEKLPSEHAKKHTFRGTFGEQMPADVGGRGTFTRLSTAMGDVTMYVERFRGEDDLAGQLQKRQQAAANLARLVQGWCQQQFAKEPGYDKLREFLQRNLETDLLNVSLYLWPIGPPQLDSHQPQVEQEKTATGAAVRIAQYLVERDYFSVREIPQLARLMEVGGDERAGRLVAMLIARKLGVPAQAPLPDAIAVLADPARLERSWNKYLESTPDYKQMLAEWEEKRKTDPAAERPKPTAVYDQHWGVFVQLALAPTDELTLRLHLPAEPHTTNGIWDKAGHKEGNKEGYKEGYVEWKQRGIDAPFPTLCYAAWGAANDDYQKTHFGKVALDGKELAVYCVWNKGLSDKESAEWNTFVEGLKPGADLTRKIEGFRFSTDPPANKEGAQSLAETPRRLLLEGLMR